MGKFNFAIAKRWLTFLAVPTLPANLTLAGIIVAKGSGFAARAFLAFVSRARIDVAGAR